MSGDTTEDSGSFGSNSGRAFADKKNGNAGFGVSDCFGSGGDGLFADKNGSDSFGGGFGR